MTTRQPKVHTQLGRAAVQIFAANDRMNQILIEHLDPAAWRAKPPGKARTIAAIFTHMHNVRSKWVRLTAPHLKVPPQLNRAHCTPQQARAGLAESAARCAEMLAEALGGCGGRVEKFRRDGWAAALAGWPGNAVLHAFSRSPPSRAGVYARASARIPVAERGGVRDLELGKAVERVRVVWRPRLRFLGAPHRLSDGAMSPRPFQHDPKVNAFLEFIKGLLPSSATLPQPDGSQSSRYSTRRKLVQDTGKVK